MGLNATVNLCETEVVEVSPPYDHADITSLMLTLRLVAAGIYGLPWQDGRTSM